MATPEVHRATAEALLSASATHHLTSAQRLATLAEAQVHATLALQPGTYKVTPHTTETVSTGAKAPRTRRTIAERAADQKAAGK